VHGGFDADGVLGVQQGVYAKVNGLDASLSSFTRSMGSNRLVTPIFTMHSSAPVAVLCRLLVSVIHMHVSRFGQATGPGACGTD
jgi:hypothetical protein